MLGASVEGPTLTNISSFYTEFINPFIGVLGLCHSVKLKFVSSAAF